MRVSVIVSTYNWPDALRLTLQSLAAQTRLPDEVVIGDDGSTEATRKVIDDFRKSAPFAVVHVWHADEGFRLALSRNEAIAAATGDYIIQIDGDLVLGRHFVEDHVRVARRGFFVKGSRIRLKADYSARLCRTGRTVDIGFFNRGILKDREKNLRLPLPGRLLTPIYKRNSSSGIGCNMAYWRDDAVAVNGYDEDFSGWGAEDIDFCARLSRMGVQSMKLFRLGLCYHLYHREASRENTKENADRCRKNGKRIKAKNGLDKHL